MYNKSSNKYTWRCYKCGSDTWNKATCAKCGVRVGGALILDRGIRVRTAVVRGLIISDVVRVARMVRVGNRPPGHMAGASAEDVKLEVVLGEEDVVVDFKTVAEASAKGTRR